MKMGQALSENMPRRSLLASHSACERKSSLFVDDGAVSTASLQEHHPPWHCRQILRLSSAQRDNGKENGNYYNGLYRDYRVYIGVILG